MKVQNIKNLAVEIQQLLNENISFSLKYKLNKLAKDVQILVDQIEETRIGLLEQYAVLNEAENKYQFESDKNAEKFSKEYAEKLEEEIDLGYQFNINEFNNITNASQYQYIFELIND